MYKSSHSQADFLFTSSQRKGSCHSHPEPAFWAVSESQYAYPSWLKQLPDNAMVVFAQPCQIPENTSDSMRRMDAQIQIPGWMEQEKSVLGSDEQEMEFWMEASDIFMDELLHDAIWPHNQFIPDGSSDPAQNIKDESAGLFCSDSTQKGI